MSTVAFDTETRGLRWFDPAERAFLGSWADAEGQWVADLSRSAPTDQMLDALSGADRIVAHNLSFDVHHLREATGFDVLLCQGELHDTDILSRVLFPEGQRKGERGGHGLKNLASVYLDGDAGDPEKHILELMESIGTKKAKTGAYYDVWRAYPDVLEHYAAMDARFTHDLLPVLEAKLDDKSRRCYRLEQRVMPVLIRAEQRGVHVDPKAVKQLHKTFLKRQKQLRGELEDSLGETALGGDGSEDALVDALLGMGVPLYRKTDTGKIATNKFALQEFEADFPVIEEFLEYRTVNKFLSTYIEPMMDRDVVHPSFMQCGAWTGRMSCRSPNMQNVPKAAGKEVRSMFVPREGHAFVVVDYESIEVRLLAYYLGDAGFRQLIEDGHDPHAWMAANIHGGRVEDYHKGTPGQPTRDQAKNTLFAITYGAGAPRISDMNQIPREDAKALISKIKASLPGYHRLMKRIRSKIETVGHVTTLFGRTQPVSREKSYVGLNALIQGSAADIMKQGLVNVDEAVRDLGGVPLLVVHDEVVVEVPQDSAAEALRRTEEALIEAYDLSPRLAVSGSVVTTSYADA